MDEIRQEQIEVTQTGIAYSKKLIPAIREILPELRGDEKDDTLDYLNQIIDGINFVIEIVNATLSFINEKEMIMNKDGIEEKVQQLNEALSSHSNAQTADALEKGILPFLEIYLQIAAILLQPYQEEQ